MSFSRKSLCSMYSRFCEIILIQRMGTSTTAAHLILPRFDTRTASAAVVIECTRPPLASPHALGQSNNKLRFSPSNAVSPLLFDALSHRTASQPPCAPLSTILASPATLQMHRVHQHETLSIESDP